jgi:predicted outer membrane protein
MLVTDHTNDYAQLSAAASKANLETSKGLDAAHDKMIAPFKKLKGTTFDHRYIQDMIAAYQGNTRVHERSVRCTKR